jgi:DDE_Tnp_1-associated
MGEKRAARSLLDWLKTVPDPRNRKGRSYTLWSLLAMLILGALHGERSLRGMWMWGVKHWAELFGGLELLGTPRAPAYSTVWEVMSRLDGEALESIVGQWIDSWAEVGAVSIDGKMLRGSGRREQGALQVITGAGQDLQVVLRQMEVGSEGEVESAIRLVRSLPLDGKVVTTDAGLLHRDLAKAVLDQGGDYLGVIKNNEPDVKQMVDDWVGPHVSPPRKRTSR